MKNTYQNANMNGNTILCGPYDRIKYSCVKCGLYAQ